MSDADTKYLYSREDVNEEIAELEKYVEQLECACAWAVLQLLGKGAEPESPEFYKGVVMLCKLAIGEKNPANRKDPTRG